MEVNLHANATMTLQVRAYIQRSQAPVATLAAEPGVKRDDHSPLVETHDGDESLPHPESAWRNTSTGSWPKRPAANPGAVPHTEPSSRTPSGMPSCIASCTMTIEPALSASVTRPPLHEDKLARV